MKCLNIILALAAICSGSVGADTKVFGHLAIEVRGEGRPVLMLPGLNSAGSVWSETCEVLQPVQCHIIHLPGFAGLEAVHTESFLPEMRDSILDYVDDKDIEKPVFMGHSLGGVIALMLAIERPTLPSKLVLVDSLPFLPAVQNSGATATSVRTMAKMTQDQLLSQSDEKYRARARDTVSEMTRSESKRELLEEWINTSSRKTTADAVYELMTTDLRSGIAAIKSPTLVLGSWAAYKKYGATKVTSEAMFEEQFKALESVTIRMSDDGYHFLMWDDPEWLADEITSFLAQ